ncbi:MAG: hypothetical protein AB7S78_02715 [Candidatus Omnitrophota bacterium]
MKKINRMLFLTLTAVLTVCSGLTYADTASINELMDKSGLTKQLQNFPDMLQMGMQQAMQDAPEEKEQELNMLMEKLNQAYNVEKIKGTLVKSLETGLSESDIAAALKWLNSSLGQKITRIEEEHSTVEAEQAKVEFLTALDNADIPEERIRLVQDLEEAVFATDMLLTIVLNSQKAIMIGIMPYIPAEHRIPLQEIDVQIEMNRPLLKSQYEDYIIGSMIFVYQELSDEELGQYLEFARSDSGIKYHKTISRSFEQAFTEASVTFGKELGDVLPKE